MHPELFSIGDITIYTYGFLIALGALLGYWYTATQAKKQFGLSVDKSQTLIVLIIIASVVGGKFFVIFEDPSRYLGDPALLFKNFGSGFVFYGSLIFAVPTVYLFIRHYKLPALPMLDIIAVTACIVHGMGRLGCFFAGCCYGVPTDSIVGMNFQAGNNIDAHLHPTQLYEFLLIGSIFLFLMYKKRNQEFHGQLFLSYLILYAIGRGIIEIFRGDESRGYVIEGVLSNSQFISIILIAIAIFIYFRMKNRRVSHVNKTKIKKAF